MLCKKCHKWDARAKGLCTHCYYQERSARLHGSLEVRWMKSRCSECGIRIHKLTTRTDKLYQIWLRGKQDICFKCFEDLLKRKVWNNENHN